MSPSSPLLPPISGGSGVLAPRDIGVLPPAIVYTCVVPLDTVDGGLIPLCSLCSLVSRTSGLPSLVDTDMEEGLPSRVGLFPAPKSLLSQLRFGVSDAALAMSEACSSGLFCVLSSSALRAALFRLAFRTSSFIFRTLSSVLYMRYSDRYSSWNIIQNLYS